VKEGSNFVLGLLKAPEKFA